MVVPVPVPVEVPPGYWQRESSHVPRPASPLMRSVMPVINDCFRRMFTEMGVLPDTLEWREIGGWVYTRVVPPGGGKDRKPPPAFLLRLLVRVVPVLRRKVKTATEAVRSDRFGGYLDQWYEQWRPELVAGIADLRAVDPPGLDETELARHLDEVLALAQRAWETHFILHGVNAYILADLAFTCRDVLGWDDGRALELLSGLSNASTTPAERIADLAAVARNRPAVRALVEAEVVDPDRLAAADPEFAAAFAAYQDEFGFAASATRRPTRAWPKFPR
jgi:rifampicin phosphotransferase